jgi:CRP/FNR family cyclic AMP-dependent transcriptional regulator
MLEAQLKQVPFFGMLSKNELSAIARETDEIDLPPGKVLTHQGDLGHEFFVIIDGTAEVVRDGAPLAELGPGDFFGEMALLDEDRRTATVRATSPMRAIVMTRASFRQIDRSMPRVHEAITQAIKERRAAQHAAAG